MKYARLLIVLLFGTLVFTAVPAHAMDYDGARQFVAKAPAKRPHIVHAPARDENIGDSLNWQNRHRGKVMDQNFQVVNDRLGKGGWSIWMIHWATARQNGYKYIVKPGTHQVRKMSKAEQRRQISRWTTGQVSRWRAGPGYHSRSPKTWEQAVRNAKRVGVQITPELKNPKFARPGVAKQMVATAKKYNYALWPMTLANMRNARGKVEAFGAQGVTVALIGGKKGQAAKNRLYRQSRAIPWRHLPHRW